MFQLVFPMFKLPNIFFSASRTNTGTWENDSEENSGPRKSLGLAFLPLEGSIPEWGAGCEEEGWVTTPISEGNRPAARA